ncbi:hypothetical protein [Acidiferrobacter sp.]|uniref:hypothetical protein n=1 Tax=Acidiferrobacter sp. TaxID=1872107 RepID=UPI002629C45A|nr:hypothetical protein [Acidiferrobacter sp.]
MMPTLSVPLRPFVPHARTVMLRPYRALAATIVPDLGLRLIFPGGAPPARFALTNPLFSAARLGRRAILITVARGAHKRYCGNAFMDWRGFYVSLLLCTTTSGRHYTSDILFTRPPRPQTMPPRRPRPSPWARAWAYAAFGPTPQTVIRKRIFATRGARTIALRVRRLWLMPGEQVLGFALLRVKGPLGLVHGALLYRGRHKWRRIPAALACRSSKTDRRVACALALAPPARPVRRWHLIVLTALGPVRLSW